MHPTFRKFIYTLAFLIAFGVGISRLYLGAHWFTDVAAAWLLSTALITLVILSYQRQSEKPINAFGIFGVSIAALIIMFCFYHHQNHAQLKIDYAKIVNLPKTTTSFGINWVGREATDFFTNRQNELIWFSFTKNQFGMGW